MSETGKTPDTGKKISLAGAVIVNRTRFRLDPAQDRVVMDGTSPKEERVTLWLTRRMTVALFQQLRTRMEKDSPAGKTPSAWRDEALALEHAAILKSAEGKVPAKPWSGEVKPQLVTNLAIKPLDGGRHRIVFFSGQKAVAVMPTGKVPMHRLAAMLALRIQQSRWDVALDLSWLAKPPMPDPGKKKAN